MKIKSLLKIDLPRERLQKYGVGKLADYELIAILLGSGVKDLNVLELSKKIVRLIQKVGLDKLTVDVLTQVHGLGRIKAGQIIATLEYGRRVHAEKQEVILNPEKVFELCSDIRDSKREHFIVFYLNSRNAIIAREVISIGTLDASLVHPREVFEPALRHSASKICLAHNHPSCSLLPSAEDELLTERLIQAGKMMGIQVVDHLILTKKNYSSLLSTDWS